MNQIAKKLLEAWEQDKQEKKNFEWALTDSDCLQFSRRKEMFPTVFQLVQANELPYEDGRRFTVSSATIDLMDYTDKEIEDIAKMYEYDLNTEPQYLSEAIFETEVAGVELFTASPVRSWNQTVEAIQNIVKLDLYEYLELPLDNKDAVTLKIFDYVGDDINASSCLEFQIHAEALYDFLTQVDDDRTLSEFLATYDSEEAAVVYEYSSDDGRVLSEEVTYVDAVHQDYAEYLEKNPATELSIQEFYYSIYKNEGQYQSFEEQLQNAHEKQLTQNTKSNERTQTRSDDEPAL